MILDIAKDKLKGYFDLSPYMESEESARKTILDGVSFRGPNIVILILAIFIASLGLNTNSPAVIIGAMLISPLMGPIIGVGLGAGTYDFALIKRSARNLAAAALFSVIASTLFFLISPVSEGRSELLARTSPTIYDVLIGFFGGGAGIVAAACRQKGNVIPGVAIATALMPPLCTAGYGLATWQLQYFTGAFYLFLINSIFIAFATLVGVKLFKFTPVNFVDELRRRKVQRIVLSIVVVTLLPSVYLTFLMIRDSYFINDANNFVDNNFVFSNTQVFSKKAYISHWKKHIDVTLIGESVDIDSLQVAMARQLQESPILRGSTLHITQGFGAGSANISKAPRESIGEVFTAAMNQIDGQKAEIDSLRSQILRREAFDSLSYTIAPEIKVLYPQIADIAICRTLVCNTATRSLDTVNLAIIKHTSPIADQTRLTRYLETRTGLGNIRIIDSGK